MGIASAAGGLLNLAKASISVQGGSPAGLLTGGNRLTCRFNPQEYTISTSALWHSESINGQKPPEPYYVRPEPHTLSMELFFDDWESFSGDVSDDVEQLMSWTRPREDADMNPPVLAFNWGIKTMFEGYLESVSARYTLFRRDGTPVRAHVNVTFKEIPADAKLTNPTSGGITGRRSAVVSEGETLQSIAWREYRDAGRWRVLAEANAIDDPLALTPGRPLLIPSRAQAAKA